MGCLILTVSSLSVILWFAWMAVCFSVEWSVQCSDTVQGQCFYCWVILLFGYCCSDFLFSSLLLFSFPISVFSLTPAVMTVLYQWKSSCYPVCALIGRTFKCKTQSFSVPCSIAHLIHASSCGVAIQTIPSSARPRKDHPLMAPCVGMGRYLHNLFFQ